MYKNVQKQEIKKRFSIYKAKDKDKEGFEKKRKNKEQKTLKNDGSTRH